MLGTIEGLEHLATEPPLLLLLDGLVKRDGATSGLRGEVCVGVRRGEQYRWWAAELGPRFQAGFIDEVSPSAHVTVCLPESEAQHLLDGSPVDPRLCHVAGDRGLFVDFLERYTSRKSTLNMRIHTLKGAKSKRGQR